MTAAHGLHHDDDVLVGEDLVVIGRNAVAERMVREGAQIEDVLDVERFTVKSCGKRRGVFMNDLGHAAADDAETKYRDMDHGICCPFLSAFLTGTLS